MRTDTLIHHKDESKLQSDLVEINRKISHWRQKESEVAFYLGKYLNEQADIINQMQAEKESEIAKSLFQDTFIIEPSEYEQHGVYDMEQWEEDEEVEVHVCRETRWHYLHFPNDTVDRYYMVIGREDGFFDTLEELQDWARPLYFQ